MANIRKSFNFRNGVQIDNDKFVVNANGLVGIGTSAPSVYKLNVYGNTRTTGLTTTQNLYAQNVEISGITTVGVLTAGIINVANGVNVGGALTAATLKLANGETVDNLIGFARTTFITDGVGIHTTSKVGIGTTSNANYQLDILGNTRVTGIVSATTFIGNLTGIATTATNLSDGANITTGTINNARLPDVITSNINTSSGVSTFTELKVGTAITMSAGIITATTFSGSLLTSSLTGTISTSQILNNAVTDAKIDTVSASKLTGALPAISGASLTSVPAASITGSPNTILGVTTTGNLTAGTITGAGLSVTSIGIGTVIPANTFQQRATGATELQITSDTSSASITVGREPGTSNTNNAEFRYGGAGGFALSNAQSLDIVNYGTGNFNYYLSANNAGAAAGDYVWHKGANSSQLMSLTKDGNLGIGITNPSHKLDVQGISTFTGNAHFESNVTIDGNLTVNLGGAFSVSGLVSATSFQGDLLAPDGLATIIDTGTGNGSNGLSFVNTNVTTGVSTFNNIKQSNNAYAAFATNDPQGFDAIGGNALRFVINPPTLPSGSGSPRVVVTQKGCIGSGTTNPQCALDLGSATANDDGESYSSDRFMILPKVSTTNRGNLNNLTAGALIYNTSLNKIQVYTGSGWETVTSS